MTTGRSAATEAYWRAFVEATGTPDQGYDVVAFGDSAELADELAALVVAGPKRATAGLLRDVAPDGEPMPVVLERFRVVWPPEIADR